MRARTKSQAMHIPRKWKPTVIAGGVILFIVISSLGYMIYRKEAKKRQAPDSNSMQLPRHSQEIVAIPNFSQRDMDVTRRERNLRRVRGLGDLRRVSLDGEEPTGNEGFQQSVPQSGAPKSIQKHPRRKTASACVGEKPPTTRGVGINQRTSETNSDGYGDEAEPEVCTALEIKMTRIRPGQVKLVDIVPPLRAGMPDKKTERRRTSKHIRFEDVH